MTMWRRWVGGPALMAAPMLLVLGVALGPVRSGALGLTAALMQGVCSRVERSAVWSKRWDLRSPWFRSEFRSGAARNQPADQLASRFVE